MRYGAVSMNRLQRFAELDGTTDSVRSFQERVLEGVDLKTKRLLIFIFCCAVWSLWLIRNEFVFNYIVVSSPEVCVPVYLVYAEMGDPEQGR